ncbi:camk/dcamkl protein kinase [Aphelenchoides avenae]|nr:camk/dcamkl protein kinase [Aphelenchus avenae]
MDALKIVSKDNADEIKDLVRTEVELMRSIAHEHIVELRNFWLHDDAWFIQLELIPDGDLFEHMRKVRVLDERNAASAIRCLASALEYLHANAIVHRDVKPENLLIYTDEANLLRLKLADFGLATKVNEGELLYHICGTPTYVAPEVLAEYGYSSPADCWSMGVILYVMLCGFPPFMSMRGDEMELFDKILRCELEFPAPAWEAISWSAKWLVRSLLFPDADSRLAPTDMLTRAWIKTPGHVDPEEEKESELQMHSEEDEEAGDEGASAEYYHSRRASMDELSDCRDEKSFSPVDYDSSDDDEGGGREKSFIFVSTNK